MRVHVTPELRFAVVIAIITTWYRRVRFLVYS